MIPRARKLLKKLSLLVPLAFGVAAIGAAELNAAVNGPWQGAELRSKREFGVSGTPLRVTWRAKPAPGNCTITLLSLFNGDRIFTNNQGRWSEIDFEIYGGSYNQPSKHAFQTQYITYNELTDAATQRGRGHAVQHYIGGPVADIWDGGFHDFQIEWLPSAGSDARIVYRVDGQVIRSDVGGDIPRLENLLEANTGVWISKVNDKDSWGCTDTSDRPEQTVVTVDSFRIEEQRGESWTVIEDRPFNWDGDIDSGFDRSNWGFESFDGTYCYGNANRTSENYLRLELDRNCGYNDYSVPVRPALPRPEGLTDKAVYTFTSANSNLCLDVENFSTALSAPLLQWDCHGGNNQQFRLVPSGAGYYELRNVNSGLCLDVASYSLSEGAQILQFTCHGGPNQKFAVQSLGNQTYSLKALHSGQCLSFGGPDSAAHRAPAVQQRCDGSAKQAWRLAPVAR
ncbi:MAG: glycosyl hydrolase family protein [Proteobacteria bacterium]|nr:MAG: glycosyl hydrolase family protein [Pseudomonadota bacterium]